MMNWSDAADAQHNDFKTFFVAIQILKGSQGPFAQAAIKRSISDVLASTSLYNHFDEKDTEGDARAS